MKNKALITMVRLFLIILTRHFIGVIGNDELINRCSDRERDLWLRNQKMT